MSCLFFIFRITGSNPWKSSGHLNGQKNTLVRDKVREKENGVQGRGTMLSALNFDWIAHCLPPFNYLFNAF